VVLREAGRFIIKGDHEFIALSEKKTKSITITGATGASYAAAHFHEYETSPSFSVFETADVFPQDLLNDYKIDEISIYGIVSLLDMSLTSQPADAIARLKGVHNEYWISRQPLTSWNNEDCIKLLFSAYQTTPENALITIVEGVLTTTTKKVSIPGFSPIKSSYSVARLKDKLYLYSLTDILGYCAASTAGGSIAGTATLDQRLVIGVGYLPEEVEELLAPSQ
jgi:hypothetical protein